MRLRVVSHANLKAAQRTYIQVSFPFQIAIKYLNAVDLVDKMELFVLVLKVSQAYHSHHYCSYKYAVCWRVSVQAATSMRSLISEQSQSYYHSRQAEASVSRCSLSRLCSIWPPQEET